jgi:hypothetical protein
MNEGEQRRSPRLAGHGGGERKTGTKSSFTIPHHRRHVKYIDAWSTCDYAMAAADPLSETFLADAAGLGLSLREQTAPPSTESTSLEGRVRWLETQVRNLLSQGRGSRPGPRHHHPPILTGSLGR